MVNVVQIIAGALGIILKILEKSLLSSSLFSANSFGKTFDIVEGQ